MGKNNWGPVFGAAWLFNGEMERRDALLRQTLEQARREDWEAAQADGRDREADRKAREVQATLDRMLQLQCRVLGHAAGGHSEDGLPNPLCSDCGAVLDHDKCCRTFQLAFAEGNADIEHDMPEMAVRSFTRALKLLPTNPRSPQPSSVPSRAGDPRAVTLVSRAVAHLCRAVAHSCVATAKSEADEDQASEQENQAALEDNQAALKSLESALMMAPSLLEALEWRAVMLTILGRSEDALAAYDAVLEATSAAKRLKDKKQRIGQARLGRARVLQRLGRNVEAFDEAERVLVVLVDDDEALDVRADSALGLRGAAEKALASGNTSEALVCIDRCLKAALDDPAILSLLREVAEAEVASGSYREALVCIDRLPRLAPDEPALLYLRAQASSGLGDLEPALETLRGAVTSDPALRKRASIDVAFAPLRSSYLKPSFDDLIRPRLAERVARLFG
jgi:tetratricopeptide (TPR) repeat protein